MDFHLYLEYGPLLLKGIGYTLYVCLGALVIGLIGGLVFSLIYQIDNVLVKIIYRVYITIFRGTPLLVQLFLVFYGGPFIGINASAMEVGIWGLGLYGCAYFAEIYRAGFESIPKGHIEAAFDLGFSPAQVFWHIRLPQMFGLIMPPMLNQTMLLVKESAVLSVITVPEMTTSAVKMSTETFSVIEPYLFLAVCYWIITFLISKASMAFERYSTRYLTN
ncbi:amino acid ABC transporter permease [Vibrio viridaestus]|uniref:Amino acid ABC transporter permease n=1 Tax=Vibrio viridaestus TaxID=2487322 RepID=A0A3N9TDP6_9VIBR|nr:amino acid ABC transporter permease [Vibrio viridaestus]RQW62337.1 amino acid ABC transporter permease [Vibrio viridaestus]